MFVVTSGTRTFTRSQSMKRKLGMTAALVVALALTGYAQKTDFSGAWTPDVPADATSTPPAGGGGGGGRGGGGPAGGSAAAHGPPGRAAERHRGPQPPPRRRG